MNKHVFKYLAASFMLLASVSLYAQKAYKVNTSESKVNWKGKKPTGEHTGNVKLTGGELLIDKSEIKGGSFTIDLNSIVNTDINNTEANIKLVAHLKSPDFFDVQKFPTAKYVITGVSNQKATASEPLKTTHRVDGELTIKGITKKVSFDASINILNGKFTASTPEFTINRTEWGVNYQSKSVVAGLKDEFIYDDISLAIELVSE